MTANGVSGNQVAILLEDDTNVDKIRTDQWRSPSSSSRSSTSGKSSSVSRSSSSSSLVHSCSQGSSNVALDQPKEEKPRRSQIWPSKMKASASSFNWGKVAVSIGRGKSEEEIRKASRETCARLRINNNRLAKQVREERWASMSHSQERWVPPPSQDSHNSSGHSWGTQTQSSQISDRAKKMRTRWRTQDLHFWRMRQKQKYPPTESSSDSD